MPEPPLPLRRHFLFRSSDLDYTRSVLSRLYKSHGLAVRDARRPLDVTTHLARYGDITLSYLNYGTEVSMQPRRTECLESFLVVQIPVRGRAVVLCGKESLDSSPEVASVVTPTLPMQMRWQGDCRQITIRIERVHLEQHCANLLGRPLRRPIEFALGMPLNVGGGRRFLRLVETVLANLDDEDLPIPAIIERELVQALMTALLLEQPSNYRESLTSTTRPAAPWYVRRIEDFIEANAAEALTVEALARVAGISVRSVHEGFRRWRGTTPLEHLRAVRLERARAALRAADPSLTSVARIATSWGFNHLGRFSQDYRRRFGESPSVTLRQ